MKLPDSEPTQIAESGTNFGNIAKTLVGKAGQIKNGSLYIETTIDLGILPQEQWPAATQTLVITYNLSGGEPVLFTFQDDPDDRTISGNGKMIAVKKSINFI